MVKVKVAACELNGRKVGRIIGLVTLDNDATIQEALDYNYVVGKKDSIKAVVAGVLKAMVDGVKRDGNGRKIDGFLSLNTFAKGRLADITDELTKDIAKVSLKARMLKDFAVDTSGWSFIIEGSTGTLVIDVITTGEEVGTIFFNEDVAINGRELAMGTGDTISWVVPETGATGTVAAQHVTSDATRITIAKEGLTGLFVAANDGCDAVFTVKIGNRKAVKSAVLHAGA